MGQRMGDTTMTTRKAIGIWTLLLAALAAVAYAQGTRIEPGSLMVGSAPGPASGNVHRKLNVVGAGEAGGISNSGNKTATLLLASTGGGANDGGAIEFGFGYGSFGPSFAGIKGLAADGTSHTTGDLAVYTRASSGATSMSEGLRVDSGGRVTAVRQPGFLAYNSTDRTGISSTATVTFDAEAYDTAGNFASNVFTAPVAGIYLLCTTVWVNDEIGGSDSTTTLQIVTTNRKFKLVNDSEQTTLSTHAYSGCVLADLAATHTASVQLGVSGAVTIQGESFSGLPYESYFSGRLLP
jgi:hypothetical protein